MKLSLIGHNYRYELEKLVRIFLPFEKITFEEIEFNEDNCALCSMKVLEEKTILISRLNLFNKTAEFSDEIYNNTLDYFKECERILAVLLFKCFQKITGYTSPWGILTGVRPAKLFSKLTKEMGLEEATKYFKDMLLVSEKKIALCNDSINKEEEIISLSRDNSFSLYISIPFCPTRCTYCSFVSHSIKQANNLIPNYLKLLNEEIVYTANIAKKLNLNLETIYIGGGTPTTLSAGQLENLLKTITDNFDIKSLREFTVEAGRPDTITEEKLLTIKDAGVTRISINPQTMNNSVLEKIGRKHTAQDTIDAFNLARKCGFNNINMDLIAGLLDDTLESFRETVGEVIKLNPESVTVHSLSIKRSSYLNKGEEFSLNHDDAGEMVDLAKNRLLVAKIYPYYMYRQSKTVGNLENVGYSKKGFECLYNVYIMDETHTILSCGASAVTKLRGNNGNYIERIFNFKYPYEYINRFNEIISRKRSILKFYEKYFK